jgi:alkylation response protein AidB-like acyl-CoA dehydrogenase
MNYQPPLGDIEHIFFNVLQGAEQMQALVPFADTDADLMRQVMSEAGKFVAQQIAPLQRDGDEIGCTWKAGEVTTPPGFRGAYQAFWQAGWPALACETEHGGQGLPAILEAVLFEMLCGANHGWTMAPGLLHGAYECIRHHGSEALKKTYLEKVATGEWLATMCLTEPHAGSDLGLARTRAVEQADGSFHVNGTKCFISGGEHDLTDNIVHLVLARLPDAPTGPKGLSLFLVPKFLPDRRHNAVHCERIEEKMGLHGSPTCVMRFDDATGWIIGQPNRGLQAMFVMMNSARLHVGLQGVGLLEAAWQKADAYSRERRQMRAPGPRTSGEAADLIAEHPAMRRILDTQRAWIDGGRVLAYRTAIELELAKHHPDASRRDSAQRWCALVTPVLKAALTHQAFYGASECLQVFGGHGYVREWGIEQIVRDSRVAMIYEGTNEIQAIDLLARKVMADGGTGLAALLHELSADLDQGAMADANETLATKARFAQIITLTNDLCNAAKSDRTLAYWVADDYLRVVALALLGLAWVQIQSSPASTESQDENPARWTAPAAALQHWVLPEFDMRVGIIRRHMASQ